jgi:sensor histidine kinase regulating citrate/malate metabolism
MAVNSRQAGMSIITLIFILAVLAAVGAVALQAFPSVIEYQAALRAVNKAKSEGSVAAVRAAFDRSADIDSISSIQGKDLEITKEGDQVVVGFAYQKEFHMFGPAWLTLKYEGRSHPGR